MLRGKGVDQLVWRLTMSGVFDVRFFYKLLSSPTTDAFPWECIWRTEVPKRVSFFLWTTINDGILTIYNLIKKGQSLVNRCYLCCCDGNQWTTFFFIVSSLTLYGVKFLQCLGSSG